MISPPTAQPIRRQATSRASVWVLAVGTFVVGTDAFVVAGFLPEMSAELGVSIAAAGLSVSIFAFSYAVLSPIIATVTATFPRRRLLILALSVLAAANLFSALAPTLGVLLISRVLAAAGAAAYTPNAGAVAAALVSPERRGRALATVIGGLTVATAIGVPIGALAAQMMGWRVALAVVSALSGVVALTLAFGLPGLDGGERLKLRARLAVLNNRTVLGILPVTILGMAAAYTAYAYAIPAFGALQIEQENVQWMLFVYGIGAILGAQISGRLTDRLGGVPVLIVGYIMMAVTLAAFTGLALSTTVAPIIVGVLSLAWGATSWCQTPPQQHRLIEAAPEQAPLVIALNSSALYLGISFGTGVGGVAGATEPAWMFLSGAALAVLALVTLVLTSHKSPRVDARL